MNRNRRNFLAGAAGAVLGLLGWRPAKAAVISQTFNPVNLDVDRFTAGMSEPQELRPVWKLASTLGEFNSWTRVRMSELRPGDRFVMFDGEEPYCDALYRAVSNPYPDETAVCGIDAEAEDVPFSQRFRKFWLLASPDTTFLMVPKL